MLSVLANFALSRLRHADFQTEFPGSRFDLFQGITELQAKQKNVRKNASNTLDWAY